MPQERGSSAGVGAQSGRGGSRESTRSSTPHSGLEAARTIPGPRTPGPTPYLGREGKQQQQRAGWRWHRAQSLLLQPQHVREAPLAGDPQPGQHLRRRKSAARGSETREGRAPAGGRGRAGALGAPIPAWEESRPAPPPSFFPHPRPRSDTAQSAAHTWLARSPGTRVRAARATPSGAWPSLASGPSPLLPPTSDGSAESSPPRDPYAGADGWHLGARGTPLGPCETETAGADARLRVGAPGGKGTEAVRDATHFVQHLKGKCTEKNTKIKPVIEAATWPGLTLSNAVPEQRCT